jgi:hypothetical protein
VDHHYNILQRTVEHEMGRNNIEAGRQITIWENIKSTKEIFIGTNGFRTLIAFMPAAVQQLTGLAVVSSPSLKEVTDAARLVNTRVTLPSKLVLPTLSCSPSSFHSSPLSSPSSELSQQTLLVVVLCSSPQH